MKLGTETGSLVNHLHSRGTRGQPTPVVGMGVTFLSWSDRSPGTIQRVFKLGSCSAIEVTGDSYKRVDSNGMSECQEYEYTQHPDGHRTTYRFRNDKWEGVVQDSETKRWRMRKIGGLRIGEREKYHDFSF